MTRFNKILELLNDNPDADVIISPAYANESGFLAKFISSSDNIFTFCDYDCDYWDCYADEIDEIILDDQTVIKIEDIMDDDSLPDNRFRRSY
jgi:hypothetical protein